MILEMERLKWIMKNNHMMNRPKKEIVKAMKHYGLYSKTTSEKKINLDDLILRARIKMYGTGI